MTVVSDDLWQEFHTVINMTSRELEEWLRTEDAAEDAEELPEQAGRPMGRAVVGILGKRRGDLTAHDAEVMQRVVEVVATQRGPQYEPKAGSAQWRHHLMDLGHDPLKPLRQIDGGRRANE